MTPLTADGDQGLRADARKNRRRLLDAATQSILEVGGEPSRDAVARSAGVGIATLYRHFPDQQTLLRAVALHVLDRTISAGREALDETPDGGEALRRYLHAGIDLGLGALNIIHPLLDDTDWQDRRRAATALLDELVARARRDGAIGADVTTNDIALVGIRFSRPLAIGLDSEDERAVTHRQVDVFLDGLAARSV